MFRIVINNFPFSYRLQKRNSSEPIFSLSFTMNWNQDGRNSQSSSTLQIGCQNLFRFNRKIINYQIQWLSYYEIDSYMDYLNLMINNTANQLQSAPLVPVAILPATQGDITYMPSKYSKAFNNYSRNQIKSIMPFIASISRTCSYGSLYPICKLLKAISKIFMLNEIEVIFLAYLIRETEWDIRDKTIYQNADNVQDIIYYSIDNLDYKRIILYLMITAYTVKFYLNENTTDILQEANKRCPNFKQIFQSWNKKHSIIITKINPRTLNSVYKKLHSNTKQDTLDFNMMVDAIIQISPAYNPEREKQQSKKKGNNDRKQSQTTIKKQQLQLKHDKSGFMPQPALFSSSGLLNMAVTHQPGANSMPTVSQQSALNTFENSINNGNNLSGLNPFMPYKSDRIRQDYLGMIGSSVVGGLQGEINNQENQDIDCRQIDLGLNEGLSQEHIVFEDKPNCNNYGSGFQPLNQSYVHFVVNNEQSPCYTSIINLTRRSSALLSKDKDGGSQIFIGSNPNDKPQRRQASIIKLDVGIKANNQKK